MGIKVVKRKVKLTPTQRAVMRTPAERVADGLAKSTAKTQRTGVSSSVGSRDVLSKPGFFKKNYHPNSKGKNQ
jgi:hypothetical protein